VGESRLNSAECSGNRHVSTRNPGTSPIVWLLRTRWRVLAAYGGVVPLTSSTIADFGRSGQHPFLVHSTGDVHISSTIIRTRRWEPVTSQIVSTLLGPGDGFLDVGANIGWYAVLAARLVGRTGSVVAAEPDPANYEVLRSNTTRFEQVTALPLALASHSGTMRLTKSMVNFGDHRLSAVNQGAEVSARPVIDVPVSTIDALIENGTVKLDALRVVKVDTQGAETLIFRGGKRLQADLPLRCALVVEFAPNLLRHHGQDHINELLGVLTHFDRPLYMVRKRTLKRTTFTELADIARKCAPLGDELAVDVLVPPADVADVRRIRSAVRKVFFYSR
jgi:FkbM family methyltransferase